jgi:hypothetical protein
MTTKTKTKTRSDTKPTQNGDALKKRRGKTSVKVPGAEAMKPCTSIIR